MESMAREPDVALLMSFSGKITLPKMISLLSLLLTQASQLGVYKAFVDNYKVALETAEKCSQASSQFQEISEVHFLSFEKPISESLKTDKLTFRFRGPHTV